MTLKLKLLAAGLLISPAGSLTGILFLGHAQCSLALPVFSKDMEVSVYTVFGAVVVVAECIWEKGMLCACYKGTVRTSQGEKLKLILQELRVQAPFTVLLF